MPELDIGRIYYRLRYALLDTCEWQSCGLVYKCDVCDVCFNET